MTNRLITADILASDGGRSLRQSTGYINPKWSEILGRAYSLPGATALVSPHLTAPNRVQIGEVMGERQPHRPAGRQR